jgi:hypothetical protein
MIKRVRHFSTILMSTKKACTLNNEAVRLLDVRGGEFFFLTKIGDQVFLERTPSDRGHQVRYYFSNNAYRMGNVDFSKELNKFFPDHKRRFIIELHTTQSNEYFTIQPYNPNL